MTNPEMNGASGVRFFIHNNSETEDFTQSTEMIKDNSYLTEVQRLQIMFQCNVSDVYKSDECKDLMNHLQDYCKLLLTTKTCSDIIDVIDSDACIEFFRNYLIIAIENCSQMVENISQRQYTNLIRFTMALWNMSDKFDTLCARMVAADVHLYLIRLLGKMQITLVLLEQRQILLFSMTIVGILYNINQKLQYTRAQYRNENLVKYLMPLAALDISEDLISLKTAALLLLAFLVNENENDVLNAKDDHIIYILEILKATVSSSELYSRYYGYHCNEILNSLRNIASPDSNKRSLIRNGVLSIIGQVIEVENEEKYPNEIIASLELLWSLSFSKECLLALDADGCELKARVEILAQNTNQNIILSARGILWNINSSQKSISFNNLIRSEAKTPNVNGHIMISYQHSTQEIMIQVKNKLISNGYQVWMDVDHMRGSFVDAMADGIQHAAVLVLGMCQAFKNSPHCRQEVKYAYTLGIPLVPIMLEPGFLPDGWLGLMCATLIHTEFIDLSIFDQSILQLQRQLGTLGYHKNGSLSNQDSIDGSCSVQLTKEYTQVSNISNTTDLVESIRSNESNNINDVPKYFNEISVDDPSFMSFNSKKSKKLTFEKSDCIFCIQPNLQVLSWSQSQCSTWLSENHIPVETYGYPLKEIDGPLLLELAHMKSTAPEMFFKSLKEDLKMDFLHILRLSHALRSFDKMS